MKTPLYKKPLFEERLFPVALTLLCLVLYIPNLGGRDLWCGRETLYAEVARETLLNGHWFVPYFNGEIYYNKPPLYFWFIALVSIPVGDVTEFTLRLPSALAATGTALVVYFLGKRLYDARTGLLAGVILATSPEFHKYACIAKLEALLTLFVTSSIAAFYVGLNTSHNKRWYFLWGWFLMGLAMLTKGLGLVLIAPVILLYLLWRRELHRLWETEPLLGGLILLATMMIWLLPGYIIGGPYYIQGLIGHFSQHVGQGPSYIKPLHYLTESLVGTAPWSLILPALFFYLRRGDATDGQKEGLKLSAAWYIAMWLVFSAILLKRARYILPMYPAIALAAAALWGHYITKASETWPKLKLTPAIILPPLTVAALMAITTHLVTLTPLTGGAAVLCVIMLLTTWWLLIRAGQYKALFISLLMMITCFETAYAQIILPARSQAGAEKGVCKKALANMEAGARWTLYRFFSPDYVFYGRTHVKTLNTEEELVDFLSSRERVYCIVRGRDYAKMNPSALGIKIFKITELQKTGKRAETLILISNRPGKPHDTTQASDT